MTDSGAGSPREPVTPAYFAAITIARTTIGLLTRDEWDDGANLPKEGGVLVCVNHISHADPFAVARYLNDRGRRPYFLAKESLFRLPFPLGALMTAAEQIPVYRDSGRAQEAYRDAEAALAKGRCVVIMPESTITKDPQQWPMVAKTGAARLGLATGCPVIPLAQWGAHEIRHRNGLPLPLPRVASRMQAGPPVELDDLRAKPADGAVLREATDRIMTAITHELEDLRGQKAPPGRWDAHLGRRILPGEELSAHDEARSVAGRAQAKDEQRG